MAFGLPRHCLWGSSHGMLRNPVPVMPLRTGRAWSVSRNVILGGLERSIVDGEMSFSV